MRKLNCNDWLQLQQIVQMLNSLQMRWDCKRACSNTRSVNCTVCWSYGDIWTINIKFTFTRTISAVFSVLKRSVASEAWTWQSTQLIFSIFMIDWMHVHDTWFGSLVRSQWLPKSKLWFLLVSLQWSSDQLHLRYHNHLHRGKVLSTLLTSFTSHQVLHQCF